jgi:hypothetical protein
MAQRPSGARLTGILYLVAAALALAAAGIRYYRNGEISWVWAAAGVFCLAMGLAAWKRAQPAGGTAGPRHDRDPTA